MTDQQAKKLTRSRLIRYFAVAPPHIGRNRMYRTLGGEVEWWHRGSLQWAKTVRLDASDFTKPNDRYTEITEAQVHERQHRTALRNISTAVAWLENNP